MSDFLQAARAGDLAKVKAMLATDRSLLHARDDDNDTAFHLAAWKGHEDLVSFFIKEGCDVHDQGFMGRSVLMRAGECDKDNSNIVRALIKAGARINDKAQHEEWDVTALHLAAQVSDVKTLNTLILCGANVNLKRKNGSEPIHVAAELGSIEKLELLIQAGASINALANGNWTPIMLASRGNKPAHIKLLHLCGGDINAVLTDGWSALHVACEEQHPACVHMLLALGARTDVKDNKGRIPLDVAREEKNAEIVKMLEKTDLVPPIYRACLDGKLAQLTQLLKSGHHPNEADQLGRTALHVAVIMKNVALVKYLIKNKADPDAQDEDWMSPLHMVAINGFKPAMPMLLESADINAMEKNGCTPVMLAAKWSNHQIMTLLLQKEGIDLSAEDSESNTVLHYAAQSGNEKIMKMLLSVRKSPPSLMARNADNDSPLVVAARNYRAAIVRLILLELVPESNIERSLTTFTRSTRGLDASVRILPTNLAIEVIHNTLDEDLVQFVLDYKDKFDL